MDQVNINRIESAVGSLGAVTTSDPEVAVTIAVVIEKLRELTKDKDSFRVTEWMKHLD